MNSRKKKDKVHWVFTQDQFFNNWVFYREQPSIVLRDTYRPLQCTSCGKIDELEAVKLPFEKDVKVRSRSDILTTDDGLLCLSSRARDVFLEKQIHGLQLLPLSEEQNYFIAVPTVYVPVDLAKAGFQYEGEQCASCGRYEGVYVGPLIASFDPPEDPMTVFAPEVGRENRRGGVMGILVSEAVKKLMKESRLTGVEFIKPW